VLSSTEVRPAVVRPAIAASAREAVHGAYVDRLARCAEAQNRGRHRSRRHRHWPVTPDAAGSRARADLGGRCV